MNISELTDDDYENITFDHDFQKDIITEGLNIVKRYIQDNKLILVGGMAIDLALKAQGFKLYKDNKLPDYDFYSFHHHHDSYNLGTILAKKFDGVGIINALHTSTMRVRINFKEVADISYIPKNLYEKIPTIEYQGFRIVHPYYQMIDQHRALSLPYEKPPLETIFGRWKKDLIRYELLIKAYPMFPNVIENEKIIEYEMNIKDFSNECLCGYPAFLYWLNEAKKQGYVCEQKYDWINSFVDDGKTIKVKLPMNANFSILTDNYEKMVKQIEKVKCPVECIKNKYYPILDKVPERTEIKKGDKSYTIINNYGNLRSAYYNGKYYISNLQDIMCYLLTLSVFYDDKLANNVYLICKSIVSFACKNYKKDDKKFNKYLPTDTYYGKHNTFDSLLVQKETVDVMFDRIPKKLITPKNAYPTKENPVIDQSYYDFDPQTSPIFHFDGSII